MDIEQIIEILDREARKEGITTATKLIDVAEALFDRAAQLEAAEVVGGEDDDQPCDCIGCLDRIEPTALPPFEPSTILPGETRMQGYCSRCAGSGRLPDGQGVGPKSKCPSHNGCGGCGRIAVPSPTAKENQYP